MLRALLCSAVLLSCQGQTSRVAAPESVIDEVPTGVEGMLLDVAFQGSKLGLTVGGTTERGPSLVARTTDGGTTWTPIEVAAEGRLYDVAFASDTIACAVGYGVILRTVDAGETWASPVSAETELPWFGGVAFVDGQRGYAVGGGESPILWRTDDAGLSWRDASDLLPAGANSHGLRAILFLDGKRGIVAGDDGLLLGANDGGDRWVVVDSGTDVDWMKGLGRTGERSCLAVGSRGAVLWTSDAGASWTRWPFPFADKLNAAGVLDGGAAYVGSMQGRLFETRDEGLTWTMVFERVGSPIIGSGLRRADEPELWFACDQGTLLRVRRSEVGR